ncbi:MAG: ABC transporter ATP-binding protein [Patescibacteria group bacterium]
MIKEENDKREVAIEVKNISKRFLIPHEKIDTIKNGFINIFRKNNYEAFDVLNDISFEVRRGEFFGILGYNGCGKSTLLKILAGIYSADKGSVKIDGQISPFLELGLGFNPELSGRDNIYLNAAVLGLTKKQINEKFDKIVEFSELSRFIDQKIKNYSSGMRARLAFSVSINANRDILLMDEVLAVGDINFQSKCLKEFLKYREENKTIVLVTHNMDIVRQYCDRAMFLLDGKIKIIGKPEEVVGEYEKLSTDGIPKK